MSMNPTLMQMVVQSSIADMQRAPVTRRDVFRHVTVRPVATDPPTVRGAFPAKARRAIGWFLVGLGLRLAVSRPRPASAQ